MRARVLRQADTLEQYGARPQLVTVLHSFADAVMELDGADPFVAPPRRRDDAGADEGSVVAGYQQRLQAWM